MKTIKCPVCNWEIKDAGIKVTTEVKEFLVCCDDCAAKVQVNSKQYAENTQ